MIINNVKSASFTLPYIKYNRYVKPNWTNKGRPTGGARSKPMQITRIQSETLGKSRDVVQRIISRKSKKDYQGFLILVIIYSSRRSIHGREITKI